MDIPYLQKWSAEWSSRSFAWGMPGFYGGFALKTVCFGGKKVLLGLFLTRTGYQKPHLLGFFSCPKYSGNCIRPERRGLLGMKNGKGQNPCRKTALCQKNRPLDNLYFVFGLTYFSSFRNRSSSVPFVQYGLFRNCSS